MEILFDLKGLVSVAVVAMLVVFLAMMVDLASGLYKAKLRNEVHTSEGLRRTLMKFITYEGGMLIAVGVDILIHLSKLMELFKLSTIVNVPLVTCVVGIFLLVVEMLSVKEKADEKTRKNLSNAAEMAIKLATKEEILETLSRLLNAASQEKEKESEGGGEDEENAIKDIE